MRLEADPILQELQMKISNTLKRSANVSFEQVWSELVDLGILTTVFRFRQMDMIWACLST